MAEERTIPKHEVGEGLNRDDMVTLRYVLHNVRGSSPSSMSLLHIEDPAEAI